MSENSVLCERYIIVDRALNPLTGGIFESRELAANALDIEVGRWKTARVVRVNELIIDPSEARLARE